MASNTKRIPSKKQIEEEKEIQKLVREKNFLHHFVLTKEKELVMPFSRRPIGCGLQPFIDAYNPTLLIRCGPIDFRMNFGEYHPNKKIIRIIDETVTSAEQIQELL